MSVPPLLASCWTHAGEAAPQRPDERSPFDILDRVAAVADAGWSGIGLVHADLAEAKRTIGLPRLASAIRDAGLEFVEVEFLGDWWTTGPEREASDGVRRDLFEAAEVLGAQTIKAAGKMFSDDVDLDVMAEAFDRLADEARDSGARIALETLPFTNFRTVRDGSRFVSEVGNSNGGIIVDIWHVYRAGDTPDDLLQEVHPDHLFAVELNDALAPTPAYEDLWADTVDERRLPGEGDWDVPRFVQVISALGYEGPWGVEILSAEHRRKSLHDEVTSAIAATREVFAQADA
ncbi:sugar phosphate isomerase/epimerase [Leucobacter allii]|uniref:sugar phosphate isomerase/epimerase family protein n=1 Tax=Leucobacter allii TaxID=2932247 RepID=UPI001FD55036|nr:sugar phosphate isomerase/epimerase family protein [Leucobacter allii]UOR01366.1 sugar phosphate isomerase/epimerase [Leucobacter allii]